MGSTNKSTCLKRRTSGTGRKKQLLLLSLLLAAVLLLSACEGNKVKASNKAISVGKQAIRAVDDYLDGNITNEEARDKIKELRDEMDYAITLDYHAENYGADNIVSSRLLGIYLYLMNDNLGGDSENYDKLIEERNELAEEIGEKKR